MTIPGPCPLKAMTLGKPSMLRGTICHAILPSRACSKACNRKKNNL